MRFFFYGTLIDADVRRAVLGRRAPAAVEPATLAGWRRVRLPKVTYPAIVPDRRSAVEGVLARGLDGQAQDRLVAYESPAYDLIEVPVTTGAGRQVTALVFAAKPGSTRAIGIWDFAEWRRRHKRRFLAGLTRRGRPA